MGKIKRIHVNQHKIRANIKLDNKEPVIAIRTSKKVHYAWEVECKGKTKIVYRPEQPLSCGARLWMETTDDVIICETGEVL